VTALLLDAVLAQPVQTVLVPELHARLVVTVLRHQLRAPLPLLNTAVAAVVRWLQAQGAIGQAIPPAVIQLLRELLRRPYMPDRQIVLGLLGRPPLRALTRELMVGTLLDYGRKLRAGGAEPPAPGQKAPPPKGGFSALGRLASEAVRKGSAVAMAVAPGVTSAVSDEFERQMQRRAAEFTDGAVDDLMQRAATTITDPQHRAEQTDLKLALLDYVLTLRGPVLAQEIERIEPHAVSELVRVAALSWFERETAEAELVALFHKIREQAPNQTISALLSEAGVLDPVRAALLPLFVQATGPLISSGALGRALTGSGAE
jgi:hypothetical protein